MNRDHPFRPYLELVRPPALFTAPADTLTGFTLVWLGLTGNPSHVDGGIALLTCIICSISIYAAGMVCNDLFDQNIDTIESPERPLPSARINRQSAWYFACSLQLIALLFATYLSMQTALICGLTIQATYLYNALPRTLRLSPACMGLCRVLNLWIGVAAACSVGPVSDLTTLQELALFCSIGTGVFVTALTWFSRYEAQLELTEHEKQGASRAATLMLISSLAPCIWAIFDITGIGGYLSLILALWLGHQLKSTILMNTITSHHQRRAMVMTGIRSVAILNICLIIANADLRPIGLLTAGLIGIGMVASSQVARWFYGT